MGQETARKCHTDWMVNGEPVCLAGKEYIVKMCSGEDAGYCDVIGENGTFWATHIDVSEHFED